MSNYSDPDEIVKLSVSENERLSFSLPKEEADRLRKAAKSGDVSISKKIRQVINTGLFFQEEYDEGGDIFIVKDNKTKQIELE